MSRPQQGSALERVRGLAREVAKFGAVGGIGVLVNQTVRTPVVRVVISAPARCPG
ncbi:hypothetical protein ABT331_39200 [Streptomyces sp. NPDC000659]|uniref:hypothetical protein n=1 Tax=Streptomyces sp. NPDC000659 TaxID=3154367 RepID=UPI0033247E60